MQIVIFMLLPSHCNTVTFYQPNKTLKTDPHLLGMETGSLVPEYLNTNSNRVKAINFYRASAVAASPVLATIGMSVCLSVRLSVRPSHAGTV